jgi:hypothetical protein
MLRLLARRLHVVMPGSGCCTHACCCMPAWQSIQGSPSALLLLPARILLSAGKAPAFSDVL